MLHTLFSINGLKDYWNFKGDNFRIFDSREFKSDYSLEETFDNIKKSFLGLYYHNSLKPYFDSILNKQRFYVKRNRPVFTTEEAIFMKYFDLDSTNIEEYQIAVGPFRLFTFEDCKGSPAEKIPYMILYSSAYSSINKKYDKYITVFLNREVIDQVSDEGGIVLDRTLALILTHMIYTYIDVKLTENNVPVNNIVNPLHPYEAIILQENCTVSDARFIYTYYRTALELTLSILDSTKIHSVVELNNYCLMLPEIFFDKDDGSSIYDDIFKIAYDRAVKCKEESDDDVVNICSDIYDLLVPYIAIERIEEYDEEDCYEDDDYETETEEDADAEP